MAPAERPSPRRWLGWKVWDRSLTTEIARLAQVDPASVARVDERCDSLLYRLMKVYMRGSFRTEPARRRD